MGGISSARARSSPSRHWTKPEESETLCSGTSLSSRSTLIPMPWNEGRRHDFVRWLLPPPIGKEGKHPPYQGDHRGTSDSARLFQQSLCPLSSRSDVLRTHKTWYKC
jgi:hypothetical protein